MSHKLSYSTFINMLCRGRWLNLEACWVIRTLGGGEVKIILNRVIFSADRKIFFHRKTRIVQKISNNSMLPSYTSQRFASHPPHPLHDQEFRKTSGELCASSTCQHILVMAASLLRKVTSSSSSSSTSSSAGKKLRISICRDDALGFFVTQQQTSSSGPLSWSRFLRRFKSVLTRSLLILKNKLGAI